MPGAEHRLVVVEIRTSSDDAFSLCDIDGVQLQARRSNVGHGASEAAPVAEHNQVCRA